MIDAKGALEASSEIPCGASTLRVTDLQISITLAGRTMTAVDDLGFEVRRASMLGLVGESGSGKSLTALAIAGMLPPAARITGGSIEFAGQDLVTVSETAMQRIRSRHIGMVFQDPLASLNPLMTIGAQIVEAMRLHGATRAVAAARAVDLLRLVGIPGAAKAMDDYPHQFSGGMRQRVMIAIAVANHPELLIADEPTTALDVTIQAEVLRLFGKLRSELDTAVLLITHDMGVVESVCDDVMVLYGGRLMEAGSRVDVLSAPRHPYAARLLQSVPRLSAPLTERLPAIPGQPPTLGSVSSGCVFAPRCAKATGECHTDRPPLEATGEGAGHVAACWHPVSAASSAPAAPAQAIRTAREQPSCEPLLVMRDIVVDYRSRRQRRRDVGAPAVRGVTLAVHAGRTLGLVGESGCGKTTLTRAMANLVDIDSGELTIDGQSWADADRGGRQRMRATVQLVFQDPFASLNPRWRVRDLVVEGARNLNRKRAHEAGELLEMVGLGGEFLDRYPHELSGGQRQRIGIARALAVDPALIVADEPVSALDVSVQAQVINLLDDLRAQLGIGFVFVTHDLAVARHVADDLAVMYRGRVVEQGPAAKVFEQPRHPYTIALMASSPGGDDTRLAASAPAVARTAAAGPLGTGCAFRDRCSIGPAFRDDRGRCESTTPALAGGGGHLSACHFTDEVRAGLADV